MKIAGRDNKARSRDTARIIDDLYAGTLDTGAWNRALIGMADLIGSSGAFLFSVNPQTDVILRDEIHRLDAEAVSLYRRDWIGRDCRLHAALAVPVGEPIFERGMDLPEKWENTAVYNDFLVPHDTPYILATWLHKAPDKVVVLSFQASCRRGSFDDADADRIKPLMTHVRRALAIRDRLEAHQIHADTLGSAIEGLQYGLFILDGQGCILHVSGLAEMLLRSEPAIRREKDHTLWLREPAGSRLRDLVRAGQYTQFGPNTTFVVPRGNGHADLIIMVSPMPTLPVTWIGVDPRWLVFVSDPDRCATPTAELASRDFGLSEREGEVAALLSMGYDLVRISRRLGITMETSRSHLKHIFDKTGIRSQRELIRRILTAPGRFLARHR